MRPSTATGLVLVTIAMVAACTTTGPSQPDEERRATELSMDPEGFDLVEECAATDRGYVMPYPEDWHADAECTRFHPAPIDDDLAEGEIAVALRVVADRSPEQLHEELTRLADTILADDRRPAADGREARVVELVAGPHGGTLWPRGARVTVTLIDAGTHSLAMMTSDQVADLEPGGYDLALRAHTQMRRELVWGEDAGH